MAELRLRMPSELIGFSNAEYPFTVPDDLTPEDVARLHWDYTMRFLLEQQKIANEPVTEAQEEAVTKAAVEALTEKLPATTIGEEKSEAPWDKPPVEAATKPWETKPTFDWS